MSGSDVCSAGLVSLVGASCRRRSRRPSATEEVDEEEVLGMVLMR